MIRPRLFWDDGAGRSLFATVGGTTEHRQGGTVAGAVTPDGSAFEEALDTSRLDGGVVGRFLTRPRPSGSPACSPSATWWPSAPAAPLSTPAGPAAASRSTRPSSPRGSGERSSCAPRRPKPVANAPSPTDAYGSQFLVRYKRGPLQVIGTHTYLRSTESDPDRGGRRETPLTPRHAAELAALFEEESRGRLGVEVSYTGRQSLEVDPYRREGAPYVEVSALAELRLGETSVFLHATNLTGVRQTGFDPLLLPARAPDGRWTTDLWAPLEGRSLNAGVRVEF